MDDTDILLAIFVGIISGAITCMLWYYNALHSRKARTGTRKDAKEVVTRNIQARINHRIANKGRRERYAADTEQVSKGETSSNDAENEMSMKEKFYLFLEKGFCPELERGVKDPMYRYYGGRMKSKATDDKTIDVEQFLCPFNDALDSEEGLNNYSNEQSESPSNQHQEVSTIEQMMRLAETSQGKCPFDFGTPPMQQPEQQSERECPFSFGLVDGADSEDEADVPAGHGNGKCPLNRHEAMSDAEQTRSRCAAEHKDVAEKSSTSSPRVEYNSQTAESTLSEEDLLQESKVQEEQMAAILRLLETQEGSHIAENPSELKSQLKMYM